MTYYRLTSNGPQRTPGPDWDVCIIRAAGYMACIDWGPCWHRYLVIDRQTRRHYIRTTGPRTTVREIDRHAARRAYAAAGKPTLRPVLH